MIEASRCPACQRVATPGEDRCLACRAQTQATELPSEGTVLTYALAEETWVALVELEGEARVLARVDEEPSIGGTVRLEDDAIVEAQG